MSPIVADGVSFAFPPPLTPAASLKELALVRSRGRQRTGRTVALREVSFTVGRGEVLGLAGANGAGKTTLLRVLAGVLRPDSGRVIVRGRVSPLIGLGVGFHPELTVTENVVLYSALIGRDPREAEREVREIAEWADLESYLDAPLRTLSTGMMIRLGFSVATHAWPDVVLMDEVVAVGDAAFRSLVAERLDTLLARGCAVVTASHDAEQLERVSDRVLWLHRGACRALGPPPDVLDRYREQVPLEGSAR